MQAATCSDEPRFQTAPAAAPGIPSRQDLDAARAGDARAIERLLLPHEPMLRAVCRGVLGGSTADADDAVQETFLRALRNLTRYRGDAKLSTWLTRIAVNVCVDQKRRERPQVAWEEWDEERQTTAPANFATATHGPGQPERRALDREVARQALQILSPHRRAAFLLSDVEGWTMREVGEAMGWAVPRVKVELYRARRQLAAWVRRHEEEMKR